MIAWVGVSRGIFLGVRAFLIDQSRVASPSKGAEKILRSALVRAEASKKVHGARRWEKLLRRIEREPNPRLVEGVGVPNPPFRDTPRVQPLADKVPMRRPDLRTLRHLALALPLLLAASCSDDPKALTKDGFNAINSGDAKGAVTAFDKALAKMDATNPDYLRAAVGRCQALARTDSAKAKTEFLALAKAQTSKIQDQDFHVVVSEFVNAGKFLDGIDVMEAGIKMFPESTKMAEIKTAVVAASTKEGDPKVLSKLKGLGYIQ